MKLDLSLQLRAAHLPQPETEYKFLPERKFRFDYAWPVQRVALECNGGVWTGGRHTRGKGYIRDMEKLNLATLRGWRVLQCTPQQLSDGTALDLITRALNLNQ